MAESFDIIVLGSGFGGSIASLIAAKLGHKVLMLERSRHPRFAIGESSTPFANLLLENLGVRYGLPELVALSEYGRWKKVHPNIPVGLKRGFTFLSHEVNCDYAPAPDRTNQLLVAASPNDALADTHWHRASLDQHLALLAANAGVTAREGCAITAMIPGNRPIVTYAVEGEQREARAKLVIDATGPRGVLHRLLGLSESPLPHMPETEALYSHFAEVKALPERFFPGTDLPFAPEDAAVHHLFPGGWIWALRFDNGIMSAGVSATKEVARRLRFDDGEPAWKRLLDELPALKNQFDGSGLVLPFVHQPQLTFRTNELCGPGWLMLPSAALFIDPLLSTGFPLTFLGIARVAKLLSDLPICDDGVMRYERECMADGFAAEALIATLFQHLGRFDRFRELSLLYFAASIFAEHQVRKGNEAWLHQIPLRGDPAFHADMVAICDSADAMTCSALRERIRRLIAPIDVAGLNDDSARNWFPFR